MSSKKRLDGCWTCRLRRKKCDEARPHCRPCSNLGLTCYFSSDKPEWMDGGQKQRQMAHRMKNQIKQSASYRRERHLAQVEANASSGPNQLVFVPETDFKSKVSPDEQLEGSTSSEDPIDNGARLGESISNVTIENEHPVHGLHQRPQTGGVDSHLTMNTSSSQHQRFSSGTQSLGERSNSDDSISSSDLSFEPNFNPDFFMKYVDYVFPFLFPFYQPAFFETGRTWLLLLRQNAVANHAILSLAGYFFTVALTDAYPGRHDFCKGELWDRIVAQSDIGFDIFQRQIQNLNDSRLDMGIPQKVSAMESSIQFLLFDVMLGKTSNWVVHLRPALSLFDEIFWTGIPEPVASRYLSVLELVGKNTWYSIDPDLYIWSPEQAGFRFFTALLIFIDTIASTALEKQPHLLDCHSMLLSEADRGPPDNQCVELQLSNVVGCQNWVLMSIAKIATLDVQMKESKKAGTFSMMKLAEDARFISLNLHQRLSLLNEPGSPAPGIQSPFQLKSLGLGYLASSSPSRLTQTKIWVYAALIYLEVVVSGWQPSNAVIRSHVAQALELLETITFPAYLRSLAWPLCVAGCMAEPGFQEQKFRDLFTGLRDVEVIGPLGDTRRIMEKVWERRNTLVDDSWDIAACLGVLGSPVLLI